MSRDQAILTVSELYRSWYGALVRYARRLAGDERAAEDVVQESFMALYRQLASGRQVDNPKAWTFCVVRREVLRQARRRQGREVPIEDSLLLEASAHPEADQGEIDFDRMMRILTRREEEVVLLRLEAMTYREIGEQLGITPSSVNTLLARALKKLRLFLASPPAATRCPAGEEPRHA